MGNRALCTKVRKDGETYCAFHKIVMEQRVEREAAREVWREVLYRLWGERSPLRARQALAAALMEGRITDRYALIYAPVLERETRMLLDEMGLQEEVPVGALQALAQDNQNVHTPAVNQQTDANMAILLDTLVPGDQDTLSELEMYWEEKHPKSLHAVMKDMKKWYRTKTCRTTEDHLYRKVLDGLWARILLSPAREELMVRLWEECHESLRMCCDGHLSRLCNVLCGFEDAFKAPVSVGELLQQKISAIAEMEIPTEDKVGEAWAVFEELQVPMEQREAWIEAF
jgi:hypothetical protein